MRHAVETLIRAHEDNFNRGLAGEDVAEAEAALFTSCFLAASPQGVFCGQNDDGFRTQVGQGFEHYRATGARRMSVRRVDTTPLDELHGAARVGWRAVYAKPSGEETVLDFDVVYLVRLEDGVAKVFAWVAGDEEAARKAAGVA